MAKNRVLSVLSETATFSRDRFKLFCFYFWYRNHCLLSLSNQRKITKLTWECSWWDFLGRKTVTRLLVKSVSAVQPRSLHAGTRLLSLTVCPWYEERWSRGPVWWGPAVYEDNMVLRWINCAQSAILREDRRVPEDFRRFIYVWIVTAEESVRRSVESTALFGNGPRIKNMLSQTCKFCSHVT